MLTDFPHYSSREELDTFMRYEAVRATERESDINVSLF